jgi:hypothetical protein
MASRLGFSSAAATRSLSASCLFTAASVACAPGATLMSTCSDTRTIDTKKCGGASSQQLAACSLQSSSEQQGLLGNLIKLYRHAFSTQCVISRHLLTADAP